MPVRLAMLTRSAGARSQRPGVWIAPSLAVPAVLAIAARLPSRCASPEPDRVNQPLPLMSSSRCWRSTEGILGTGQGQRRDRVFGRPRPDPNPATAAADRQQHRQEPHGVADAGRALARVSLWLFLPPSGRVSSRRAGRRRPPARSTSGCCPGRCRRAPGRCRPS